ncbi:MAG: fatty acid oxidation complex subunit alpha FadB [Gammaproteobacteria bacterium]|nr:fatty acid oxidation complex subunit alpha FadB [Gammaproteobacteria bacterium]MDP7455180.1 fatty acid oxidation complex subunit alpha FadB [Gammaproteobacteria bacterium]
MIYTGKALSARTLPSGIAQVVFDLEASSVNKFDEHTLVELKAAVAALQAAEIEGVIFSSAKSTFIVGGDITEFTGKFDQEEQQIIDWLVEANAIFSAIEDMKVPTVSAINGVALGGGFELAIATDYRIATARAVVGFPETKLGILPGFGGTVRLPRLIGADNANQWISSAAHIKAPQALSEGAVDAIVEDELLLEAAEDLIQQCNEGKLDYARIRKQKTSPLTLTPVELTVAFDTAKAMVAAKAGPHYPAPLTAVQVMHDAAMLDRAGALLVEHKGFVKLAKTEVATNLVQMFLNDQFLAGCAKKQLAAAGEVKLAGVLGAGIMGGGIAYQSALKGTPILMKDVAQEGIDLGMSEVKKLLAKQMARGRMDGAKMAAILSSINPTLDYDGFDRADIVVEAIVENTAIKKTVLAELEEVVKDSAIIASNTSTISIDTLAEVLQRPENFCGMHFFNPVAVMPLVEVIRGEKSSYETIATVVVYAKKMGKTPIVVNNCPGFLVNRILFPYFGAYSQLLRDGADFRQIDKAMEKFGWPMGPAYLLDVIGVDTAVHCQGVMAAGFDRMAVDFESAIDALYARKQLGQKTGAGFYRYEPDKKGRPSKLENPQIDEIIATVQPAKRDFENQEIVERMMIALCLETVRCLEDGIVATAIEADMALVLGLGFPPFRGGALRYIDSLGLSQFCELADKYAELGALYSATDKLRQMADAGEHFYSEYLDQAEG